MLRFLNKYVTIRDSVFLKSFEWSSSLKINNDSAKEITKNYLPLANRLNKSN